LRIQQKPALEAIAPFGEDGEPLRRHGHLDPTENARSSLAVGRRPRRPSPTSEEFLKKALEMFLEKGFDGTTMEAVTGAAGIAKRTVYLRYGDKKSLFRAAVTRAIEEWIVPIESLRAVETEQLDETLLAIGQILVDNILSPAGLRLMRITNAESGRMPDMGEYFIHEGSDRTIAYLADLFERQLGQDSGFSSAVDAAEAFLHLVVGGPSNAAAWGVVSDKETIDRRVAYSVNLFLNGLRSQAVSEKAGLPPKELETELRRIRALIKDVSRQLFDV
jgi:AcrR family transcriptional regulator